MSGLKILLVEDDDVDVMTVRRALGAAGVEHELEVRRDGREAIARLKSVSQDGEDAMPDLVILDLNLPMLSGLEVLEKIKSTTGLGRLPVAILTTSGYESDVGRALDLGAAGYFVKPVHFEQFVAVIGTLCRYWSLAASRPRIVVNSADTTAPKATRILVVEDDTVDMLALQRLADARGLPWELVPAYSLSEARECLDREEVDLVLLDQMLPDGLGTNLLDHLGEIPAIFVAGEQGDSLREEAFRRGALGFIAKNPMRSYLSELPEMVASALEKRGDSTPK